MAGESATQVAEHARAKADRLRRRAEMFERGAAGEAATASALARLPEGWATRHDVAWPGRQRANIDHIVIGPAGVFVIDSKNWSTPVTINKGTLWSGRYPKTNEVQRASAAAAAVAGLAPGLPVGLVRGVLCFTQGHPLDGEVGGVRVCTTDSVVASLLAGPPMLSPTQVAALTAALEGGLRAATDDRCGDVRVAQVEAVVASVPEAAVTSPGRHRGARRRFGLLSARA